MLIGASQRILSRAGLCLLALSLCSASAAQDILPGERVSIQQALQRGDLNTAATHILVLGKAASAEAAKYLLTFIKVPQKGIFDAMVQALASFTDEAALQLLAKRFKEAKGPDAWEERVLIAKALAQSNASPTALDVLNLAVDDPDSKVRLAAARGIAAGKWTVAESVPLLIKSLIAAEKAKDAGSPHLVSRIGLVNSTGYDFSSAALWDEFWKKEGPAFTPEKKGGQTEAALQRELEYFEQTITSRRILFVVDTSASMNLWDWEGYTDTPKIPKGSGGGADRASVQLRGADWNNWMAKHPEAQRIHLAKTELTQILGKLPEDAWFNVMSFNTKVLSWKPALVQATAAEKKAALSFVDRLMPSGNTCTDTVFEEVFKNNGKADTIYFLSDGHPSHDGKAYLPAAPILERIAFLNRFHVMTIHAFGIGKEGEDLMKALGEQNGGTYRDLRADPPKKFAPK